MQTRRDQLQAYRFQNRRALAALVTGEPNVVEAPMRRLTITTLSGIMIAILVVAGFAVFGLIKPAANDDWKANGAVIVTNETAAIFIRFDGVLHPVVNYASAVLAVSSNGSQQATVVHVDRSVLNGAKRGSTIGIQGLPTSLPAAADLVSAPFTVCSRTQAGAGTTLITKVSVEIGDSLGASPLSPGTAVVVRSAGADGTDYLIAGGRRLAITSPQVATSLQLNTSQVVTVGTAFLDGVQAGTPLRTPTVPGAGTPYRTKIAGRTVSVGQLLDDTDDQRFLLVLTDGVAELTDVQARLFETVPLPPTNAIATPVQVARSDVINLPPSKSWSDTVVQQFAGLPTSVPRTSAQPSQQGGLCVLYRGGASVSLAVPATLLPTYSLAQVSQSALSGRGIADTVAVSGGKAAVVRSNDHSTTTYLVAEPGLRYAAKAPDVLAGFGYAEVTPATVPAQLLALIPVGRALDPQAARTPVSN